MPVRPAWSFGVPPALARYIAPKGSVAVDGVSLTINAVESASLRRQSDPAYADGDDSRAAGGRHARQSRDRPGRALRRAAAGRAGGNPDCSSTSLRIRRLDQRLVCSQCRHLSVRARRRLRAAGGDPAGAAAAGADPVRLHARCRQWRPQLQLCPGAAAGVATTITAWRSPRHAGTATPSCVSHAVCVFAPARALRLGALRRCRFRRPTFRCSAQSVRSPRPVILRAQSARAPPSPPEVRNEPERVQRARRTAQCCADGTLSQHGSAAVGSAAAPSRRER